VAARAVAATGGDGEGVVCIAAPAAILALDAHRDIILGPSSAWEHRLNRCQQTLGEHRVSERCVNTGTPRRRLHTNVPTCLVIRWRHAACCRISVCVRTDAKRNILGAINASLTVRLCDVSRREAYHVRCVRSWCVASLRRFQGLS
jgi:hypothetical protein